MYVKMLYNFLINRNSISFCNFDETLPYTAPKILKSLKNVHQHSEGTNDTKLKT